MKSQELLGKYINRNQHPRKKGRYYASEISAIRKKWKLPEDFFKPHKITDNFDGILNGTMKEDFLAKIFTKMEINCACGKKQNKYEIPIDCGESGVVIVCKPDFEFMKEVWETKAPMTYRKFNEVKESYKDQLECEFRATGKQVKLGYFVEGQIFPILVPYKPSDVRWKNICKKILEFHEAVNNSLDKK